jgi:hypothetical protein
VYFSLIRISLYTWSNCQEGQNLIKERLDRGVANSTWYELFPAAEVWVDFSWNSDHALLILKLMGQQQCKARRNLSMRHLGSSTMIIKI